MIHFDFDWTQDMQPKRVFSFCLSVYGIDTELTLYFDHFLKGSTFEVFFFGLEICLEIAQVSESMLLSIKTNLSFTYPSDATNNVNAIGQSKKTCTQSFILTNDNLYCMTDGIYSHHTLIKRSLIKACRMYYMIT